MGRKTLTVSLAAALSMLAAAAPAQMRQNGHSMDHSAMEHGATGHGAMDHSAMGSGAMDHSAMGYGAQGNGAGALPGTMRPLAALPSEPGQSAFAAISEIVAMLRADPATDWARVDIAALQQHLADMDALALGAEVTASPSPQGLTMRISLAGRAGAAAGRMVPAHGPVLAAETGWQSQVTQEDGAIQWQVSDPTGRDSAQIRALGFFGLMAVGDHHRAHHMAMARGAAAH